MVVHIQEKKMDIQGLTFFFLFFFSFSLLGEVKIFQLTVKNEKIKNSFSAI
jgi:hypothetical protein